MSHNIDMIVDFQYGSTGKGLLAGYLSKRNKYDTVVCAFGTNAGHTYIDASRNISMMTQQLPTAISSPHVKRVLIGPGALIHLQTLHDELTRYRSMMEGKTLAIHPLACVVEDYHAKQELDDGMTAIGSTAKGVGAAAIERMRRSGINPNIMAWRGAGFDDYIVSPIQYRAMLEESENTLIEGAQGFSLSMYHGKYPYVTSRDVTPWQIAADCGLPFKWSPYVHVMATMRTFPIRVNNRTGTSGPGFVDQLEIDWKDIGIEPELTTVTKLPRRLFTFSKEQIVEAIWHCGSYWNTDVFLNFANYFKDVRPLDELIALIETPTTFALNAPKVKWLGFGPDDSDVMTRKHHGGT
jgi:adenylosuccinate synthase